jgi:secondary thiamine-phosphate synthase enzyme
VRKGRIAVDGASKGNPGPAGIGVVITDEAGKVLREISEYIGEATNNIAEYSALLCALAEALEIGLSHVSIQTDSELMAKQINGQYRVKNEGIVPLYESALGLLGKFKSVSLTHVPREKNTRADKLASRAASSGGQPVLLAEEAPKTLFEVPAPPEEKPREAGMIEQIDVRTSARNQFVDITRKVQDVVTASGLSDGACIVHVPHTTAGITINENADPDVTRDIIDTLNRLVPQSASYRHVEGNSDAHVKASLMGFSVTVLVEKGQLMLGTWQGIYFCEFDGPRSRHVLVKVS